MADHSSLAREKIKYHDLHQGITRNIFRDEKEILSGWKEYIEDLFSPVRTAATDTCDMIDFGKEKVFTLTKVASAIRGLKSGKAAKGEDEIRPEMLKALNGEGVG